MIRYLEGELIGKTDRGIVVLSNGIGYEIDLTASTRRFYASKQERENDKKGEDVGVYISYQASQQQPVPRLFGFLRELERDFFEELRDVKGVGGPTALSAMSIPVPQVARAIVEEDTKTIRGLKGIGPKTADMIIAELKRRVAKYALLSDDAKGVPLEPPDFKLEVRETLVKQLGFKAQEAQRLIDEAMKGKPSISCEEDLFDEVLRIHK